MRIITKIYSNLKRSSLMSNNKLLKLSMRMIASLYNPLNKPALPILRYLRRHFQNSTHINMTFLFTIVEFSSHRPIYFSFRLHLLRVHEGVLFTHIPFLLC